MALLYTEIYKLAGNTAFQQRVQVALYRAANVVRVEDAGTPNHAARLTWSTGALRGPSASMNAVMNLVLTTGAVYNVGDAVDDATLQSIVNSLVDAFAAL